MGPISEVRGEYRERAHHDAYMLYVPLNKSVIAMDRLRGVAPIKE
jgi:hypothetical protein